MTDNEQRAHDISIAFTSLVQKLKIEAAIHNAKINEQEDCRIDNSINDYMANYLTTYKSVLNYLNDQK